MAGLKNRPKGLLSCKWTKPVLGINEKHSVKKCVSNLLVSSPGLQTDFIMSWNCKLVSCCGDTLFRRAETRREIAKVPGKGHGRDRGGGGENDEVVHALQWESPERDGELHRKHITGQSPPTFLSIEGKYVRKWRSWC